MNTPTCRQTNIGMLVLLLALIGGGYYSLRFLAGVFAPLDSQVGIVTGVAAITVLLSAAWIASAIKRARSAETVRALIAERAALYDRIVRAWSAPLAEDDQPTDRGPEDGQAELRALERRMGLLASPEVIRAYLALRRREEQGPQRNGEIQTQLCMLLAAMRRDLFASAPGSVENDLLTELLFAAEPSAKVVQPSECRPSRIPDDLRPRVSLANPR